MPLPRSTLHVARLRAGLELELDSARRASRSCRVAPIAASTIVRSTCE